MIKINLAPVEETENQYWWIPDVAIFALVLGLAVTGVKYYLGITQDEIERLNQEQIMLQQNFEAMQSDVNRHKEMSGKIKDLELLRTSLSRITESKLARYLPIILLEHIQNLKPEGVWLTGIHFKNKNENAAEVTTGQKAAASQGPMEIEISGQAYDNVILAEFMTLLKATRNQEYDASDLRTQAFFDAIGLYFSDVATSGGVVPGQTPAPQNEFVKFKIGVTYLERSESPAVDTQLTQYLKRFRERLR